MTTKEAIEWLNCLKEIHEDDISDALGTWYKDIKNDHNEVIDMAIEALEAQNAVVHMDLPEVSAEEIVEILKRNNRIELLPSIQPEKTQLSGESTTKDSTFDCISRQAAIDIERNATVDTNPSHFEAHQKFTQFMDDAEVSSFGMWQWSNGFNTALTAVGVDLKRLPPAQPELIRCKDCKYRDENWRRVSVRWLPCMDVRTGSNWYCGSAERGEQDE